MHDLIADDLAARPADTPTLVHLGDYVDRGPDSAGVVARLAAGAPLPDVPTINLMGNHEHMMLAALATGEIGGDRALARQRRRGFAAELGRSALRAAEGVAVATCRCRI